MEILLYNNLFEQNHKEQLKLAKELEQKGKMIVKKYEEYITKDDDAGEVFGIESPLDLEEIIQRTKGDMIQDEPFNGGFLHKIISESDKYLVSAMMIGPINNTKRFKYYTTNYKEILNVLNRMKEEVEHEEQSKTN